MKKVFLTVVTALMVLGAAAQNADTTSTVNGEKLNFEAPLFGLTQRNVMQKWSVVAFTGVYGGYSCRFNVPSQMNVSGCFSEVDLIELRYRPWHDGNVFSWGFSTSVERHALEKGFAFDSHGAVIPVPESWLDNKSVSIEQAFSLDIGYTHEWGDWKAGIFLSPGYGTSICGNSYRPGNAIPASGMWYGSTPGEGDEVIYYSDKADRMNANLSGNYGFRLGGKAGIWYNDIGITVGYNFSKGIGPSSSWNRYDGAHVGITVRY